MDAKIALIKVARGLISTSAVAGATLWVMGCEEPAAQAENQPGEAAPAVRQAEKLEPPSEGRDVARAATPPERLGKPSYQEEAFHLSLSAPAAIKVGEKGEFKIVLEAQGEYKVNEEYPMKFQFEKSAGVVPEKETVRKEDGKVEKSRAELPLSVTIKSSGKHEVSGRLSFSVCTEERCLIEKRDLTVEVHTS